MSTFRCPSCGDHHDLYGSGGGRAVADEYDLPLLGEIPMDPEIRERNDADGPLAVLSESPAAEPFDALADAVANRVGIRNRAEVAGIDPDDPDADIENTVPSDAYLEASETETDEEPPSETTDGVSGGLDISDG